MPGEWRRWLLKKWRGRASSLVSGIEAFRDGSRSSSNFIRKEMRLKLMGHGQPVCNVLVAFKCSWMCCFLYLFVSLLLREVEISEVRDILVFSGSQVKGWA